MVGRVDGETDGIISFSWDLFGGCGCSGKDLAINKKCNYMLRHDVLYLETRRRWDMPQHRQPVTDRAKLTMDTAAMAYNAAKCLSNTRMTWVVDEDGKKPEEGPEEILGSAILFAVAIELALNSLRMEEKEKTDKRRGAKRKNTGHHDLSGIFGSLTTENRETVANEVAILGWKVDHVLDFHQAMVVDWRYPIKRISVDGSLYWWGPEPLIATFEGIFTTWRKRYPRPESVVPNEDMEAIRHRIFTNREGVMKKMNAARITKEFNRT